MSNPHFNEDFNSRRQGGVREKKPGTGKHGKMNEKTASWGGLPGKSGPNRSGGTTKLKTYAKSEGI